MSERVVADAAGRVLKVREISMLDRLRLFKALGPELSMNDAYLGVASLAAAVTAIDDMPFLFPTSEVAIEHVVERLGEVGLDAVANLLVPPGDGPMLALAGN
ncbi:MAG TPA: hypothetical protein PK677_05355 [Acidiphilium sp.]|nr:MAG: hypothetical protein B7Z67_05270 [Acidiphilium sp. 21-60-14]OYV92533.1 MAG: hypothetical protein B7Z57_00435 [Acidiphilium sp. 37-60-79]OZB40984.1 MAG: hypothetical protein B7X48_02760 [Acidiphilium sp. 34-60-192]HQT87965.1 hypothetical protein [Acidiphilium sp.]HQU22737.1 hypothetical protein [Acidiphilium sp.]